MDETTFWRDHREIPHEQPRETKLSPDTVVALFKVFLVRSSGEFDYGVWRKLPVTLFVMYYFPCYAFNPC